MLIRRRFQCIPQNPFRKVLFPSNRCRDEKARRVAVTGVGIFTSHGLGWARNTEGFRDGRTALRRVQHFDVSGQRAQKAAELDLPETGPDCALPDSDLARMERGARMLLWAGQELVHTSGWRPDKNIPIVLGTTCGGMSSGEDFYRQNAVPGRSRRGQPTRVVYYQAQKQLSLLARAFGFGGPGVVIGNACASGANAIGHGWEMVRSGRADKVVCGGYDALCHLVFSGFNSLQALSTTSCRPFDANRDGLVLGEGVGLLALEPMESALKRKCRIFGEILGYSAATDCHHLTQPHPEGVAALKTMLEACQSAGVTPADMDYINAHGTGTIKNDAAEAEAINQWAGKWVEGIKVSSTKSSVGHTLGAAGAVEAIVCLMALQGQWIPPTSGCNEVDPACRFQVITQPTAAELRYGMSNSFGFGGANATLVFGKGS